MCVWGVCLSHHMFLVAINFKPQFENEVFQGTNLYITTHNPWDGNILSLHFGLGTNVG